MSDPGECGLAPVVFQEIWIILCQFITERRRRFPVPAPFQQFQQRLADQPDVIVSERAVGKVMFLLQVRVWGI